MPEIKLDLSKYAGDMKKRLEYISVSGIEDCFSDDFIESHTDSKTFADFCKIIGCNMLSDNDKLENGEFDSAIKAHSEFGSWTDMFKTAYQALVDRN